MRNTQVRKAFMAWGYAMALASNTTSEQQIIERVAKAERYRSVLANDRIDLIIIDHGFHTHMTPEDRITWCKLWAGVGLRNEVLGPGQLSVGLWIRVHAHMPLFP